MKAKGRRIAGLLRGRPSWLVFCFAMAALAGCTGAGKEPADPDDVPPSPTAEQPDALAEPAQEGNASMEEVEIPLSYDGETHFAFCVFSPVNGTCHYVAKSDTAFRQIEEIDGSPARLTAEITWDPVSPLSDELVAALLVQDDGEWIVSTMPTIGPSPLSVYWDLSPHAGKPLQLAVIGSKHWSAAGAAAVGGELPQPFHVEGTVTCLQPTA